MAGGLEAGEAILEQMPRTVEMLGVCELDPPGLADRHDQDLARGAGCRSHHQSGWYAWSQCHLRAGAGGGISGA